MTQSSSTSSNVPPLSGLDPGSTNNDDVVVLLYDGLLERLRLAIRALEQKDIHAKARYIRKSIQILHDGLKSSLDTEGGGDLAEKLDALYDYCGWRLIEANAKNDIGLLQEVYHLIELLGSAWQNNKTARTAHAPKAAPPTESIQVARVPGSNVYSGLISKEYEMSQQLIDYYRAIEDSSRQMLDAAKADDWDLVMRYEGVCAVLIEQLRERAKDEALTPEHRAEKTKIMQRILHNDAQIRCLAEPWLNNPPGFIQDKQTRYLH